MRASFTARFAVLIALTGIVACTESPGLTGPSQNPLNPATAGTLANMIFTCNANIVARSVSCGDLNTGLLRADIVLGGQHTYVALHSSNITVTADTIAFDVSVENLIWQPIGTSDTANTVDATGIKPFFISGPVSTGAGTILVANADGISTFTAANQKYFQYAEVALHGQTTATRRWKLQFSPEVQNFTFQLAVSAPVKWPIGYVRDIGRVITLNPFELFAMPGTVRHQLDDVASGTITYTSADPLIAPVSGKFVSTTGTPGFTKVTAESDGRPGVRDIYVDVCQATDVAEGSAVAASASNTDCSAALHQLAGFLPTTQRHGDLYRVTLTAGQTVQLVAHDGDQIDLVMTLADRLGNVLAFNDDAPCEGITASAIQYTAVNDGVYVIEVSPKVAGVQGAYVLQVHVF